MNPGTAWAQGKRGDDAGYIGGQRCVLQLVIGTSLELVRVALCGFQVIKFRL